MKYCEIKRLFTVSDEWPVVMSFYSLNSWVFSYIGNSYCDVQEAGIIKLAPVITLEVSNF